MCERDPGRRSAGTCIGIERARRPEAHGPQRQALVSRLAGAGILEDGVREHHTGVTAVVGEHRARLEKHLRLGDLQEQVSACIEPGIEAHATSGFHKKVVSGSPRKGLATDILDPRPGQILPPPEIRVEVGGAHGQACLIATLLGGVCARDIPRPGRSGIEPLGGMQESGVQMLDVCTRGEIHGLRTLARQPVAGVAIAIDRGAGLRHGAHGDLIGAQYGRHALVCCACKGWEAAGKQNAGGSGACTLLVPYRWRHPVASEGLSTIDCAAYRVLNEFCTTFQGR